MEEQEKQKLLFFADDDADPYIVRLTERQIQCKAIHGLPRDDSAGLALMATAQGLALSESGHLLRGDFSKMISRLIPNNLNHELLIKAARFKNHPEFLTAVDATAGLGQDAFLLAAYGFQVRMYERDPIIAMLLYDAMRRGRENCELAPILCRMSLKMGDSIALIPELASSPDLVLLDPMFPKRQKSGLVKKKFQLLHQLEQPCQDEDALLTAALACNPRRIIIKRPAKAGNLGRKQPSYSLRGGTIRYDCIVCRS